MFLLQQEVLWDEDFPVCFYVASSYSFISDFLKALIVFANKCDHTLAERDNLTDLADFSVGQFGVNIPSVYILYYFQLYTLSL